MDTRAKDGPIRNQLGVGAVAPAVSTGAPFSRTGNERVEAEAMVAHTLTRKHEGLDDGTGRGTPIVPWPAQVAPTLNAHFGEKQGLEDQHALGGAGLFVPFDTTQATHPANRSNPKPGDPCHPLAAGAHPPAVAYGIDEEQNGTQEFFGTLKARTQGGGFQGAVAFPLDLRNAGRDPEKHDEVNRQGVGVGDDGEPSHTLSTACVHGVAFGGDIARTLSARHDSSPCADRGMDVVASSMAVRRLTPTECERLQGFPDGWTNVPWRKKDEAPDGPRYKALGNSMAVNVMRWIGDRIAEVDAIEAT